MANTSKNTRLRVACGNATAAEVNAGKVIVKPDATRTITVIGGWMRALGGNAATATSVDIADTDSTPVVAVALGVAGLTQNAVLAFSDTTNVTKTTYGGALTAGKGLQIIHAGADLATATSVDYCVQYIVS